MTDTRSTLERTDSQSAEAQEAAGPPQPGLLLVFSEGRPLWAVLPLSDGGLELGRAQLGARVDDGRISRHHVRVHVSDGTFFATDLGSRNGSNVDGVGLVAHIARPFRHCLRIGSTLLLPAPDINPLQGFRVATQEGMVLGPRLFHAYLRIRRTAASSTLLHITGESGAGKENAARVFHKGSRAADGPFIAVNCAAIPEGIAERLLFGAKKGAFSGITADVDGYVQAANGGTLFLDEVAELSAAVQAKLLRVLETREALALGALKPQPLKLQICSASQRSLADEVVNKRLREDLYYRLGRPAERIPPLRERPEEIPWLIDLAVRKLSPGLSPHVSLVEACLSRPWPGNVRELLTEIRSAAQEALAASAPWVKLEHLSATAGMMLKTDAEPVTPSLPSQQSAEAKADPCSRCADLPSRQGVARPSRTQITMALIESKGNVSAAARQLGLHRSYLRRHIEYHGIDPKKLRGLDGA